MFGIGTVEIALILLVGLMIYGPEHLPQIARKLGQFVRQAKKLSDEVSTVVRKEMNQLERIAQLDEMKKQAGEIKEATQSVAREITEMSDLEKLEEPVEEEKTVLEQELKNEK